MVANMAGYGEGAWSFHALSRMQPYQQTKISPIQKLSEPPPSYGIFVEASEVGNIKKRWREYTEELYRKDHDPDNHDGVTPHLARYPGM